jgi:Xaa-Pro aminopeptidase
MLFNKARMLQKMDEFKLDAVIASFPENVSYMSDLQSQLPYMYRFLGVESFAFFSPRADVSPALVVARGDLAWVARYPSWMPDVYVFGNCHYALHSEATMSEGEKRFRRMLDDQDKRAETAGEALVKLLKQNGLDGGRIALDEKGLSPATREAIGAGLPRATFLDAFELIRWVRMVKTAEELDRITEAGVLNERAVQSVLDRLAPGVTEEDLAQHFLDETARYGGVFEFWNTASGTQSAMTIMGNAHHFPRARYALRPGDMFRYDGGGIYNRYHSDAGGCALLGKPSAAHTAAYRGIEAGMERGMELLRPGAIPSQLFAEVTKAVEKAGVADYSKLATFCGHGIGIEARDYPIFTRPVKASSPFLPGTYDVPIEEGMVINLEMPYSLLGLGGFQIEYTLLVGKNGCEKLYPHTRELVVR